MAHHSTQVLRSAEELLICEEIVAKFWEITTVTLYCLIRPLNCLIFAIWGGFFGNEKGGVLNTPNIPDTAMVT